MKSEKLLKSFNIFQSIGRKALQSIGEKFREINFEHADFIIQNLTLNNADIGIQIRRNKGNLFIRY